MSSSDTVDLLKIVFMLIWQTGIETRLYELLYQRPMTDSLFYWRP